jgi:predicted ATP-grasp superfamily ATP-dependent carboligase
MFQPEPQPYHVHLGFKVDRRISWDGELDEFRSHLDIVCEVLETDETVVEYSVTAHLAATSIELELVVRALSQEDAEAVASDSVAKAIREAGGFHEGLLSLKEESQAKSKLNAWAGLRTPRWQHRKAGVTKL